MSNVIGALCVLLACLASGCDSDGRGPALFQHRIVDARPGGGEDCCTDVLMLGDVDGDGSGDVVIGAQNAGGAALAWYRYPTWEKHAIAGGEFTTDGQLADVDGDGDLDVVIGSLPGGKGEVVWFENRVSTGAAWIRHDVGEGSAHDLVVGDVDGDGRLDIVTCDKKRVVLRLQAAAGRFEAQVILERSGEGIALADLDGDGDLDVVFGGSWLENPGKGAVTGAWRSYAIAPGWQRDTRVAVADVNRDGRPDVVLSVSEGPGPLSWFESPADPRGGAWIEHPIDTAELEGVHSLQVADFDGDGTPDVLAAEMHTSRHKRVRVYLNTGGGFARVLLSRSGSHNMRAADIDGDGDHDLVGKNYAGSGRALELWENLSSRARTWRYVPIDAARPASQKGKMGLVLADADHDGRVDVIAGAFLYRNPGGRLGAGWARSVVFDEGLDVFFAVAVDDNGRTDLLGLQGSTLYWLEAQDEKATGWTARAVAQVQPAGRTQGYAVGKLVPGGKPQLIFTHGRTLYALRIPDEPRAAAWPLHRISTRTEEEGIAVGDIDADGDLDIAAVATDGHHALWLENPGHLASEWAVHTIGGQVDAKRAWIDRVALADVNGDGRLDVVATEEMQDRTLTAHLYWFENPVEPRAGPWQRRIVARHRSLNSLGIGDLDGDRAPDIIVAEHTDLRDSDGAEDNLTVVYFNRKAGQSWSPLVVERGAHSSHLGARLADLDGDARPEIVSIAWNQYRSVHLWTRSR